MTRWKVPYITDRVNNFSPDLVNNNQLQAAKLYLDIFGRRAAIAATLRNVNDSISAVDGVAVNADFAGKNPEAVLAEQATASQSARGSSFQVAVAATIVVTVSGLTVLGAVTGVIPAAAVITGTAGVLIGAVAMRDAKSAEKAAVEELAARARRPDQIPELRERRADISKDLTATGDELDQAAEALRQEVGVGPEADLVAVARQIIRTAAARESTAAQTVERSTVDRSEGFSQEF